MIKTILAILQGEAEDMHVLRTAKRLAAPSRAHVRALFCARREVDPLTVMALAEFPSVAQEALDEEDVKTAERVAMVSGAFESVLAHDRKDANSSFELTVADGDAPSTVARIGKLCDLVILNRPAEEAEDRAQDLLDAAILETGRPVLLLPRRPHPRTQTAAIAWNGSCEAARALRESVALLRSYRSIVVICLDEPGQIAVDPEEVRGMLHHHGIEGTITVRRRHAGSSIAEALSQELDEVDADLLVMGAYTHGRLRQLLFHRPTRHMTAQASMPVLMAH